MAAKFFEVEDQEFHDYIAGKVDHVDYELVRKPEGTTVLTGDDMPQEPQAE